MNAPFDAIGACGRQESIGPGAVILRGFALEMEQAIIDALRLVVAASPFRQMTTPGGHTMSAAVTNCGAVGWVSSLRGYRYHPRDPLSGAPWPPMPTVFTELATEAADCAGYDGFAPDACLTNRYEPCARVTLHQDKNERDYCANRDGVARAARQISFFGGSQRTDRTSRTILNHGDVCVWGGPSRLAYHGIDPIKDGDHPVMGRSRVSLTFREAM